MNANMNTQKMNEYVQAFLLEHGSEELLEKWNDQENQEEFSKLIPKVSKTKTTKTVKDPNKPKRGKSSYLFFCADNRSKVKAELGEDAKATEVTAALGVKWNELKNSTKASDKKKVQKYEAEAQEDKERYEAEISQYDPPSDEEIMNAKKSKKLPAEKKTTEKKTTEKKTSEKKTSEKKTSEKKTSEKKTSEKKTSGYSLFCKEHRAEVKEDNPEMSAQEITKILAGMWKDLEEDEQAEWKTKAANK
jgi:hypothetical protein